MDYYHLRQAPTPLGTRLPAAVLSQIYLLALLSPTPIPLDHSAKFPSLAPILQTSSLIRARFLPSFFENNTFTLRRASLCSNKHDNIKNAPTTPAIHLPPPHHRAYIRHLRLSTYNGARTCLDLALRDVGRNNGAAERLQSLRCKLANPINNNQRLQQQQNRQHQQNHQQSCPFCNPSTFPPLVDLFPRLRSVTINLTANRVSGLCWRTFCKAVVQSREAVWVEWVGVGFGVLKSEEGFGWGLEVRVVDEKLGRVWEGIRRLGRKEVRGFVERGEQSAGAREVVRISERAGRGVLGLFGAWDSDCEAAGGGGGDGWTLISRAGARSGITAPVDLRSEACFWGREFTTALNWALREWLKRGVGGMDHGYGRAMEGGGVRDVVAAGRLEVALLEEFEAVSK